MIPIELTRINKNREYDRNMIIKIACPSSKADYLLEHPKDFEIRRKSDNTALNAEIYEAYIDGKNRQDLEELTDAELDNLLDGQENDTTDETIEPLYCNAIYNRNVKESKKAQDRVKYSSIPEGFENWTKLNQNKWLKKAKEVTGIDFRKDV